MAVIGSLSVKLGLVTVDWDQATAKAKQQAKDLQKAMNDLGSGFKQANDLWKTLGGSLSIGAIGLSALIQQTAQFADKISDLATGFGISTGFALQFSDALQQSGVSSDVASKAITSLFKNIEAAKEGNQAAVDSFRKIGIGFNEIKAATPEEAIRRVIDALSKIEDPITRVAELRKQLGKGGIGLDIQQVNSIIEGGIGKWDEYGARIDKVSKIQDNLKSSYNNLLIAFSEFIAPFTRDGIISVEKFTAALAGMATYLVANKIIAAATAMWEVVTAIRAATAAGAAFNLVAAMNPIGLLLSLASAGTAFLIYQRETKGAIGSVGDVEYDAAGNVISSGGGSNPANAPKNKPANQSSESGNVSGGNTPQEIAAMASVAAEKLKTYNDELKAAVPIWDVYQQKIVDINIAASQGLDQIKVKKEEANAKYATSKVLLGLELDKLKEQEKQININRERKLLEAQTSQSILITEQERVRQQEYLDGKMIISQDQTQRQLDVNKSILSVKLIQLGYEAQINQMEIENSALMADSVKALALENTKYQETIDKLKNQISALPDYIDGMEGMLSKEAEANNRVIEGLRQQIDFETKRHNIKIQHLEQERTFEYGMNVAINRLIDDGTNAATNAMKMVDSVYSNLSNAIDNFVKNGKFSFADLTKSIIQDLIAIAMKAQMLGLGKALFGGGGGGLAAGIGGASGADMMMAFADGGDPPVGVPSLVGENGPELFVPKSAGTIVPNKSLSSIGGGGQTINYNGPFVQNLSAIDTQSGMQFLAKNKTAVWASYQSANRSIPVTR